MLFLATRVHLATLASAHRVLITCTTHREDGSCSHQQHKAAAPSQCLLCAGILYLALQASFYLSYVFNICLSSDSFCVILRYHADKAIWHNTRMLLSAWAFPTVDLRLGERCFGAVRPPYHIKRRGYILSEDKYYLSRSCKINSNDNPYNSM